MRISAGITSAQYFNHWRGTSDFEVKDVQSRITSKLRDRYMSDCRVLNKNGIRLIEWTWFNNDKPWKYDTWIIQCRDFPRRCLRIEGQILRHYPVKELNGGMISERWQRHTETSVSMNSPSTEAVLRFACRAIRSEYSRWSSDVRFDRRGTSIGGPRSTRSAQSPSHARLPVTLEESPSRGGFDKLRSSFPILSACLWKNRCSTTASVSSDIMPRHWSLLSSLVAENFYCISVKKSTNCGESTTHMHLGEKPGDICNITF